MDTDERSKFTRVDPDWSELNSQSGGTAVDRLLQLQGEVRMTFRSAAVRLNEKHKAYCRSLAAANAATTAVPSTVPDNQHDKTAQPPPSTGQLSQPQTDASQK